VAQRQSAGLPTRTGRHRQIRPESLPPQQRRHLHLLTLTDHPRTSLLLHQDQRLRIPTTRQHIGPHRHQHLLMLTDRPRTSLLLRKEERLRIRTTRQRISPHLRHHPLTLRNRQRTSLLLLRNRTLLIRKIRSHRIRHRSILDA
jgi:hypothetical protein